MFFFSHSQVIKCSDCSNNNINNNTNVALLDYNFVWQIRLNRKEIEIELAFRTERNTHCMNAREEKKHCMCMCVFNLRYASINVQLK